VRRLPSGERGPVTVTGLDGVGRYALRREQVAGCWRQAVARTSWRCSGSGPSTSTTASLIRSIID
jgi:hypothetical protein